MKNIFGRLMIVFALAHSTSPILAAEGWGIDREKVVELQATVVDIACALGKSCPADCGAAKRQLGLLAGDGKLYAAVKSATLFAGPVHDLLPYCGKKVMVDGLLIENPMMQLFFVQNIRQTVDEKWQPAEAFEKRWTETNGKAEEWMRSDPLVKQTIADDGVFGIKGLEPAK